MTKTFKKVIACCLVAMLAISMFAGTVVSAATPTGTITIVETTVAPDVGANFSVPVKIESASANGVAAASFTLTLGEYLASYLTDIAFADESAASVTYDLNPTTGVVKVLVEASGSTTPSLDDVAAGIKDETFYITFNPGSATLTQGTYNITITDVVACDNGKITTGGVVEEGEEAIVEIADAAGVLKIAAGADVDTSLALGRTILARDKVGVRFMVVKSQLAAYDSYYLEVETQHFVSNDTERYALTDVVDKFCYVADGAQIPDGFQKQTTDDSNYVYFDYTGISAYEMTLPIKATIYCVNNGAVTKKSQTWEFTLASRILAANMTNTAADAVFVDMVNYGAAAQNYFAAQFPTSDLAKQALPTVGFEAYQQYATADSVVTAANAQNINAGVAEAGATAAVGKGVRIQAANELYFMVAPSSYNVNNLTVKVNYTNSYNSDKSKTYVVSDMELAGGVYYCYLDGDKQVALYDLSKPIVAELYDGTTKLYTRTYSVESFVAENMANSSDATMVELGDQLMKFAYSVRVALNLD